MDQVSNQTSDEPVSRTEVVEYLRNLQKAEEIAAKKSGINIWVIWGGLGMILWQFADIFVIEYPSVIFIFYRSVSVAAVVLAALSFEPCEYAYSEKP